MKRFTNKLPLFILLSIIIHFAIIYLSPYFNKFELSTPVPAELTTVDLTDQPTDKPKEEKLTPQPEKKPEPQKPDAPKEKPKPAKTPDIKTTSTEPDEIPVPSNNKNTDTAKTDKTPDNKPTEQALAQDPPRPAEPVDTPIRKVEEFLQNKMEKLTYRISMFGMPIGTVEVIATNINGEMKIKSAIKTTGLINAVYSVDNTIDTRMLYGRYITTSILQNEGGLHEATGYTLMLGEKKVFWINRTANKMREFDLPDSNALDLITGFYFLRNKQLEVNKDITIPLFDTNKYTEVPVLVLRKEHISLPGGREADTIVIQPKIDTDTLLHRSGDVTVWLTDDNAKVPVRAETSVVMGKLVMELIGAETEK
ncbi:MAG: DUF3108 domain-containing protein [Desulfuromonadales bacterium]|nr:DUF3108 domain-containing protein [Desulfuromonadales bacterium]